MREIWLPKFWGSYRRRRRVRHNFRRRIEEEDELGGSFVILHCFNEQCVSWSGVVFGPNQTGSAQTRPSELKTNKKRDKLSRPCVWPNRSFWGAGPLSASPALK